MRQAMYSIFLLYRNLFVQYQVIKNVDKSQKENANCTLTYNVEMLRTQSKEIFLTYFDKLIHVWAFKTISSKLYNFHTRFNEECTEVEEEVCKTVYDEVWEKKCEMVNITLPQTDCREFTETQMETM